MNPKMLQNSRVIKSKDFSNVDKLVITLHGYGSCGNDFAEVGDIFLSKKIDNAVFLFPDAPDICCEGTGRQWFPLDDVSHEELRKGLDYVAPIVKEYIEHNVHEYHCENVCLIGFSQGSITSFEMIFHTEISKVVAFSGLFNVPVSGQCVSKPEILIVHSTDDKVVPYSAAEQAQKDLTKFGIPVKVLPQLGIGHSISIDGWNACATFLNGE